jgi:5-methylcytosine-specific restriction endonuclease McrA
VRRRCIGCRRLLDAGSYCPACRPRPADPGRIRGRRNQERRARLTAAQGGRCAVCGRVDPLELHHRDHDPANDAPANLVMLCRRCHRLAGGLPRWSARIRDDRPRRRVLGNVASVESSG